MIWLQIKLSGSHLCVESDKEVTSKGSTLLLSVCSRTKKQVCKQTINHFSNYFIFCDVTKFGLEILSYGL